VVGGVAYISATVEKPGVVAHLNKVHKLDFGRLDGADAPLLDRLAAAGTKAGFVASIAATSRSHCGEVPLLASMAAVTAATRVSIGPIMADPELASLFRDAMEEVAALARARASPCRPMRWSGSMPSWEAAGLDEGLDGARPRQRESSGGRGTVGCDHPHGPRARRADAGAPGAMGDPAPACRRQGILIRTTKSVRKSRPE